MCADSPLSEPFLLIGPVFAISVGESDSRTPLSNLCAQPYIKGYIYHLIYTLAGASR